MSPFIRSITGFPVLVPLAADQNPKAGLKLLTTLKVEIEWMGDCLLWFDVYLLCYWEKGVWDIRWACEWGVSEAVGGVGARWRKKDGKKIWVMQPTACQCCPLEMINGPGLWWTEPERERLLFIEITSQEVGWGGLKASVSPSPLAKKPHTLQSAQERSILLNGKCSFSLGGTTWCAITALELL